MEFEPDLGERNIDLSHDWKLDSLDYTSLTIREYQKFLEKNKSKSWHRKSTHPMEWYSLTKSQTQVMTFFEDFLKRSKADVLSSPLKMLILGEAGSGKSAIIARMARRLDQQGRKYYLAGTTGVSANNINGVTLHSLFAIPWYKNSDWQSLHEESKQSKTLYDRLIDLEVLIVDEASLLGGAFLQFLNLQLQKVRGNSRDFGGVSVVLVADNTQLTPVMDVSLHRCRESVKDFAGAGIDLYRSFKSIFILRENLRQQNDQKLKNLLYNIRRKQVSRADLALLRSRLECNLDPEELVDFKESIRVFPRNKLVDAYNKRRIIQLNVPVLKIMPKQTPKRPAVVHSEPLYLGKSVRVMITRNLDIGRGIVNGSMAVVEAILFEKNKKPGKDFPSVILVKMDYQGVGPTVENKCIPIGPVAEYFHDRYTGKSFKIESFPLRVCYASTCHKLQGITVDKLSIYLDRKEWFENMSYTAISRVRDVKDLVLTDFEISDERFNSFPFFRNFVDQKAEFRRLGIYDEVMGEKNKDEDEEAEFADVELSSDASESLDLISNPMEQSLQDQIDQNLTEVDKMRVDWIESIKKAKLSDPHGTKKSASISNLPRLILVDETKPEIKQESTCQPLLANDSNYIRKEMPINLSRSMFSTTV